MALLNKSSKLEAVSADVNRLARLAKAAAKLGAILAIVCHLLPQDYRVPCSAVAHFCISLAP